MDDEAYSDEDPLGSLDVREKPPGELGVGVWNSIEEVSYERLEEPSKT